MFLFALCHQNPKWNLRVMCWSWLLSYICRGQSQSRANFQQRWMQLSAWQGPIQGKGKQNLSHGPSKKFDLIWWFCHLAKMTEFHSWPMFIQVLNLQLLMKQACCRNKNNSLTLRLVFLHTYSNYGNAPLSLALLLYAFTLYGDKRKENFMSKLLLRYFKNYLQSL